MGKESSKTGSAWTLEIIQQKIKILQTIEAGDYLKEDGKPCGRLASVIASEVWLLDNLKGSLLRLEEFYKFLELQEDGEDES